ncbi:hypothetical protein SAVIM40S_05267 [Streptomyces avidinii]
MISAVPRRRTLLATSTAAALALLVSGCGAGGTDAHRIRVGVSGDSPEWDVLAKEAKKEGLAVETVVFDDYSLPNKALSAGDIELNAFQHLVFLAQSNTENKTGIAPIAATTVVPLGLYSKKHEQIADLPDRAETALPNDPANLRLPGRAGRGPPHQQRHRAPRRAARRRSPGRGRTHPEAAGTMTAAVELRDVAKEFPGGSRAVDGVSLSVDAGTVFGVVGHSGAGKSSLLRLVNGLEEPTSGSVLLNGQDLSSLGERRLRPSGVRSA